MILCNGRIIGPLDSDEEFTNEDFSLLERFSQSTYGSKLFMRLLKDQFFNDDEYGIVIYISFIYYVHIYNFYKFMRKNNIFKITFLKILKS